MSRVGTPSCLKGISSLTAYRAYGETRALVPGVVFEGEPTLLAGAAGCGKTTTAMQIAAAVTNPEAPIELPWGPNKNMPQDGGLVVYLDFEKRGKLSGQFLLFVTSSIFDYRPNSSVLFKETPVAQRRL